MKLHLFTTLSIVAALGCSAPTRPSSLPDAGTPTKSAEQSDALRAIRQIFLISKIDISEVHFTLFRCANGTFLDEFGHQTLTGFQVRLRNNNDREIMLSDLHIGCRYNGESIAEQNVELSEPGMVFLHIPPGQSRSIRRPVFIQDLPPGTNVFIRVPPDGVI